MGVLVGISYTLSIESPFLHMAQLNTSALTKVLDTLDAGLSKLRAAEPSSIEYDLFRNATVKSFELSVEMVGKLLRKGLKAFVSDPRAVDSLVFNDVLRSAGKFGLMNAEELERWLKYRQHRNATAHDYGEKLADKTLKLLADYERDARALGQRLNKVFAADA